MEIKAVQWNINGGLILEQKGSYSGDSSFNQDGLDHIIEVLKRENPDIIGLEEVHEGKSNQTELIAKGLDLKHFVHAEYDKSHQSEGDKLSLALISRFPILDYSFEFVLKPENVLVEFNGIKAPCHDKGVLTARLDVEGKEVEVKVLHLIPFRRASIDPLSQEMSALRNDITEKLSSDKDNVLVLGDFNYDDRSLEKFLPNIFKEGLLEINTGLPTTIKNRYYDHILFKGLQPEQTVVNTSVLTDHYPIITSFNL